MNYNELKEIVERNGFMIEERSSNPGVYIYAHKSGFSTKCGNFSDPLVHRVWATAIMKGEKVSSIHIYDILETDDSGLLFVSSGKKICTVNKNNVNRKCITIAKKIKKELMKNKINKIKDMF